MVVRSTTNLTLLMAGLRDRFPFTQEVYPGADLSDPDRQLASAVKHSQFHMATTSGRIAAEAEAHDHGVAMDCESLRALASKMFIHAVVLAAALGMNDGDLVEMVASIANKGD